MTTPTPHAPSAQPFALSLAADADYVSPAYLRTPFRSFLVSHERGLYWLRMPAGAGKTAFLRGIVARRPGKDGSPEGIDSAISSGARAIAVGLGAPMCPAALVEALNGAFAAEFACPAPHAEGAADSADTFATFLGALATAAAGQGAKRLLVCIDGLEKADAATLAPARLLGPPARRRPPPRLAAGRGLAGGTLRGGGGEVRPGRGGWRP